jgi:signal transduction histidine kinase
MKEQRTQIDELQEQIRKNIALELHDSVGQSLSSIKFRIEALIRSGSVISNSTLELGLKDVIKMIQTTADEVRRISLELRPKMLDDLGLQATIEWLLNEFKKGHPDVEINRDIDIDDMYIDARLKVTIYRILQECMNNVAKHSHATELFVLLNQKQRTIELDVRDNGKGFDELDGNNAALYNGLGLRGIRERVELSGGAVEIRSAKWNGTQIRVVWVQ